MKHPPVISAILARHAEEAAFLWTHRCHLLQRGHVTLDDLAHVDGRIEAHLDGLRVAAEAAWSVLVQQCEAGVRGALFVAATRAIETAQQSRFDDVASRAAAQPGHAVELVCALGWASPSGLRGIVASLLGSPDAKLRSAGITACALHGVDPGPSLTQALRDPHAGVRVCALRACGELGRSAMLSSCLAALRDQDAGAAFWAALSAVHLGDRAEALAVLPELAEAYEAQDAQAIRWSLLALAPGPAHEWLSRLAREPRRARLLIQAAGLVGDPKYAPWLIAKMDEAPAARLAAEAFSLLTGVDPAASRMDRPAPALAENGPTDRPDDDVVAMDPDSSLPWPQPSAFADWWAANEPRFRAGGRHFMGEPLSDAACKRTLINGFQRQREIAARHMTLMHPGTKLFNIAAPAWRQKRLLAGVR